MALEASDASVVDGDRHQCMGARKHLETLCDVLYECMLNSTVKLQINHILSYQAGVDTGIVGGTKSFKLL